MSRNFFLFFGISLLVTIVLAGCSSHVNSASRTGASNSNLPIDYAQGVIVNAAGKITRLYLLKQFLTDFKHHKAGSLLITSYTSEGDPIFMKLFYNGSDIKYTFDNSRDKFGGQNKGRRTTVCRA